jgi:hypothetical protein
MASITITAAVGANRGRSGGNKEGERIAVWAALKGIPPADGGTPGLVAWDEADLVPAIKTFQKRWWPGRIPDGYFSPNGDGIRKINALLGGALSGGGTAGAGGAYQFRLTAPQKMMQGNDAWSQQKMSNSSDINDRIIVKGCLLTAMACAFNWKGIRIPAEDEAAVKAMVLKKNFTYPLRDYSALNPATLDAWMSLNNEQGYHPSRKMDADPGRLAKLIRRKELTFWGRHEPGATSAWLQMPTTAEMAKWVREEWLLIIRRSAKTNHFLWVTGFDGNETFTLHDVGFGSANEKYCGAAKVEDFDRIFRWGPA